MDGFEVHLAASANATTRRDRAYGCGWGCRTHYGVPRISNVEISSKFQSVLQARARAQRCRRASRSCNLASGLRAPALTPIRTSNCIQCCSRVGASRSLDRSSGSRHQSSGSIPSAFAEKTEWRARRPARRRTHCIGQRAKFELARVRGAIGTDDDARDPVRRRTSASLDGARAASCPRTPNVCARPSKRALATTRLVAHSLSGDCNAQVSRNNRRNHLSHRSGRGDRSSDADLLIDQTVDPASSENRAAHRQSFSLDAGIARRPCHVDIRDV